MGEDQPIWKKERLLGRPKAREDRSSVPGEDKRARE